MFAAAPVAHLVLHIVVPLAVALWRYRTQWQRSWLVMLATMAIDVDHLLADPVFDPERCSLGFHPLHSVVPVVLYVAALAHPRTRLVGVGLCLHIALDGLDCL